MKTTTRVHTPEERLQMRRQGDLLARMEQIRLLCVASILRTIIAEILPLCGSAGWWVAPLCLLPGVAVYALLAWAMKRSRCATLGEAARALMGRAGVWVLTILLALLTLLDGAASMTALVTTFTEGLGTQGTQVTMAALTLLALLLCLHRDGLAWGVWLIRWPLVLLMLSVGGVMLTMARADGVHPLMGPGGASVMAALKAGVSLGWPLILLLTAEPARPGRTRQLIRPGLWCAGAALIICLVFPCERLTQEAHLAARLLQPVMHLPQALRTLAYCLGMLVMFLSIATAVQLAAGFMLAPTGRELFWLPGVLAAAVAATQCLPVGGLWRALLLLERWIPALLVPFALVMILWRKPCSKE